MKTPKATQKNGQYYALEKTKGIFKKRKTNH